MNLRLLILPVIAGLSVYGSNAIAHQGATGVVKERMMLMEGIKKDMKQVKQLALYKNPGDKEELGNLLLSLQSHSKEILLLFPKGSLQHPSEALPEIWKDWPKFKKLSIELSTSLEEFEQLLRDGQQKSYKPQLKKISRTCSGCHDKFREEK